MDNLPLPQLFIARLQLIIPADKLPEVIKSFGKTRPTTLRTNTLKTTTAILANTFSEHGIEFDQLAWMPDAFIIKNKTVKQLTELPEHQKGHYYIQNLASMLPALVLDPQPGEEILDICAAPGSKTTQMAALMNNQGNIVANDNSRIRIYKLNANLKMQGVTCVGVTNLPAQTLWQKYPEKFDKTLVDVPCSLEGKISVLNPKSFRDWSLNRIKTLVETQKWILRSAVTATRPGGTIVYSTCTLAPEENEYVVEWILKKEKGNIELQSIKISPAPFNEGLSEWNGKKIMINHDKVVRIYPGNLSEGFFVAKFTKIKSNLPLFMKSVD